jgi:hypothetical protein
MPEGVDRRHYLPNARMGHWATHQVAGTRPPASPQVAHRFEAFQKALPRLGPLQSSAIAQSVAHGHVAAFDSFGRLATCSVQPRPDVLSAGAGGRHGLHIRLVVIGDDFLGHQLRPLYRLTEERLGTRPIQVPLFSLAEEEDLVREPAPADPTTTSDLGGWPARARIPVTT